MWALALADQELFVNEIIFFLALSGYFDSLQDNKQVSLLVLYLQHILDPNLFLIESGTVMQGFLKNNTSQISERYLNRSDDKHNTGLRLHQKVSIERMVDKMVYQKC